MAETPECVAMHICEAVVEDKRSSNKTIVNTYNGIYALQFPCKHDRFTIFVSLTNGKGEMPILVRIAKETNSEPILKLEGMANFANPLDYLDLIFDLRGIVFPEAGAYSVEFYILGELLTRRRFAVMQAKQPPQQKKGA